MREGDKIKVTLTENQFVSEEWTGKDGGGGKQIRKLPCVQSLKCTLSTLVSLITTIICHRYFYIYFTDERTEVQGIK